MYITFQFQPDVNEYLYTSHNKRTSHSSNGFTNEPKNSKQATDNNIRKIKAKRHDIIIVLNTRHMCLYNVDIICILRDCQPNFVDIS